MAGRLLAAVAIAGLLLASVVGLASVEAGPNTWSANGPSVPGVLWRLAVDPTRTATVYAAGSADSASSPAPRVYKTTDAGATWRETTNGIVNISVFALAVDPGAGATVFVGGHNPIAQSMALYRSTNGGDAWTLLGWPLTGTELDRQVLGIDIARPQVYVATTRGLLKSNDVGETWQTLAGLPAAVFRTVRVDRQSTNTVYAGGDSGVHKSLDGGATWAPASAGLPAVGATARVSQLVIHPNEPRVLWAVVAAAGGTDQVFRSIDAAATWQVASSGLPSDVIRDLTINPRIPSTMYAALNGGSGQNLARSQDGGLLWEPFSLPGGGYSSSVVVDTQDPTTIHAGHNDALWSYTISAAATVTPAATTAPARDSRFFAETGYRVDNDAFWDYFNRRGGVRVFGYPTSRTFPFLGFSSQFFQRAVLQAGPDGSVRLLNLLDPGLLPYTSFNGAQMPAIDPALVSIAPAPGSPGVVEFVRANAPNSFEGQPTNYGSSFDATVTLPVAYPRGGGDAGLLPGLNLEIWGVPTSRPTYDPNNRNFIYQRFQRGIMHYDATCRCTNGILLADYLKAIITGRNLPGDLATQAAGSSFMRQYDSSKPGWLARPEQMPSTDLTSAFEPQ